MSYPIYVVPEFATITFIDHVGIDDESPISVAPESAAPGLGRTHQLTPGQLTPGRPKHTPAASASAEASLRRRRLGGRRLRLPPLGDTMAKSL
ncbi:phenolic acid decarboxylase [Mycobacterium sp. M23085]|uniref:phenolic acid decarboxylase n=1 Tax=Mycobacterium sp. M23085 TaxID=3378087 RepID=UPI0038781F13